MAEALFVEAEDGARLATWELGGEGAPLLLLHGTSLHGRCWQPVASALPPGLRPLGVDLRGHGASGPSPDGAYPWERFALDLLTVIDSLKLASEPLMAAGHSAGGTTLVLAEYMRPGTFARIWAWEPIVNVPGSDLRAGRSAELAARARRRRSQFASLAEAREHLEGRGIFADLAPEALDAYLEGAFVDDGEGGLTLACPPQAEARMYAEAPNHHAWEALAQVSCPVRLLGGDHSPAVPPSELHLIAQQLPAAEVEVWPGYGHFGPFQQPETVAGDIAAWAVGGRPPGAARGM